jgi:dTDP-4-amino-4,6-dideoxygalactose transaminase
MNYLDLKLVTRLHLEEIEEAVKQIVDGGRYLQGEALETFERQYADYIGTRYCVGCGNGLDSLTLILRAYKEMGVMHDGDEIIVPANTYIASILAITENRLKPILVEPDINTLEIDDNLIENAVTSRTRGIMIVHLYGRCAYTNRIGELCKKYDLKLIEDNAQAHGCMFGDRRTGSLGDASGHSFYPTKNLGALGDAGAVTTDDRQLAETVRALGNYGSFKKYVCPLKGRNSRMDEVQAAVLTVKLKYLDSENNRRKELADYYIKNMRNNLITIPHDPGNRDDVYHIFPVLSPHRDRLRESLRQRGIGTEIHYPIPPHLQDCMTECHGISLPITEKIHAEELSLPLNPTLSDNEAETVVRAINEFNI